MNEGMETGKHQAQLNANKISLFPNFVLNIVTVAYNVCVCCVIKRDKQKAQTVV